MLPKALEFGMTDAQFWYEEPYLLVAYAKAYGEHQKRMLEEWQMKTNISAWINGIYIQNAVASALSKDCHYPQKPLEMFQNAGENAEKARAQSVEEQIRARSRKIDVLLGKN